MTPFLIVGGIGLVLVLVSLLFDEIFDFLDGALSGTAVGSALVVFGASGAIAVSNGLPEWSAYLISALVGIVVLIARAAADPQPAPQRGRRAQLPRRSLRRRPGRTSPTTSAR